jgi:hypothetical protein
MSNFAEKLDACESPMEAFSMLYADAPAPIQSFLDGALLEILMVEMPKLQICIEQGPTAPATTASEVEDTFDKSMTHLSTNHPEVFKEMSATVRDAAKNIAAEIDKGIRRVLLDDELCNRATSIDLIAEHARITKCLTDIALTPVQLQQIAECEDGTEDDVSKAWDDDTD